MQAQPITLDSIRNIPAYSDARAELRRVYETGRDAGDAVRVLVAPGQTLEAVMLGSSADTWNLSDTDGTRAIGEASAAFYILENGAIFVQTFAREDLTLVGVDGEPLRTRGSELHGEAAESLSSLTDGTNIPDGTVLTRVWFDALAAALVRFPALDGLHDCAHLHPHATGQDTLERVDAYLNQRGF